MTLIKSLLFLIVLLVLLTTPAFGSDLTIVTPYWGNESNTYINNQHGFNLTDSQTTRGLYIQNINSEKYQWNIFFYQTNAINYSNLAGVNFIYDLYFGNDMVNKKVIGFGFNYLETDLSGQGVPTQNGVLDKMDLELTVLSPYLRVGKYFNLNQDQWHVSILPWIGGQLDKSSGEGLVDPPGPRVVAFKVDEGDFYWITGINLKIEFSHFLQLEAKHSIVRNSNQFLNKTSALLNFFLTKNLGISYRYNYHETPEGKDNYNLLGLTMVF